jgi:small subunit ribosomal protein S8
MQLDIIADTLTRIRNACKRNHYFVVVPLIKSTHGIVKVLCNQGYVAGFKIYPNARTSGRIGSICIILRKKNEGEARIERLKQVSTPGRRFYCRGKKMPHVFNGLGIAIISTSKGIMSEKEARERNIGGEIICTVW